MGTVPKQKYIPASDAVPDEIFEYPFTVEDETTDFIKQHGRVMFIIRGPPGTGKNSLASMLERAYPNSKVCSADQFFTDTFSLTKRDPASLKLSHEFCHTKVESACRRSAHPIIVKNTHMKKFEMQTYLDYAAKYKYTVIMAVTLHKFHVTPEILAESNTKGLNADYFRYRLKQWEEVIPVNTGWFMCPDDSSFLLNELQVALDYLLGDGKFCRIVDVYEKADLLQYYKARKLLYCIAACGDHNMSHEIKSYYLSDEVKEQYGRCFTTIVQGYLVMPLYISAIVDLSATMKNLLDLKSSSHDNDLDFLLEKFSAVSLGVNFSTHCKTTNFDAEFQGSGKTANFLKREEHAGIDTKSCGFMILAQKEESGLMPPAKLINIFNSRLASAADESGIIGSGQFRELDSDFEVCRLSDDAWLLKPPNKVSFQTVFTGLYV